MFSQLPCADVSRHQSSTSRTTPNVPTTALQIPQINPNSQMVKAPQTNVQSNGVPNATVEEKVVNDFLHNLVCSVFLLLLSVSFYLSWGKLAENLISAGPKPSTSSKDPISATLPKSTELQPSNLSNAQNVRHSGTVPKDAVQVPTSNPEGIPGLNVATVQMIRQKNPATHLPTPPSSAPLVPIRQNSQNV